MERRKNGTTKYKGFSLSHEIIELIDTMSEMTGKNKNIIIETALRQVYGGYIREGEKRE